MKQLFKSLSFRPKRLFRTKKPSSNSSTVSRHRDYHRDAVTDAVFKFDVVSAFRLIDRDNNGKIDRYELKSLFNKSLSDEELGEMIDEIDVDGDGCITLDELQTVGSLFESTAREEEDELRAAFDFFDFDHDGRISADELYLGFRKIGDERCTLEDCRRMIEEVDVNKDGIVCFGDFSRMMEVVPA
ncbi:hypothetical protein RND81_12G009400 [Saponaria officinalis]|uniref:EF-hand domain-containing protein n=1 Tax=Saponaria officinalis TaxID=3572 RepID=A0AAW1H1U0_SAPOF